MFKPDIDTYRFFKSDSKMMFEKPEAWGDPTDMGQADALYRTARAYVAYKETILKEGILSCFKKESDGKYQAYRCYPDYGADDVSRDQTIAALSSLLMNGDVKEFKEIGPNLRFRLSKRYIQGPGMWLWLRQWWTLYGIVDLLPTVVGTLWNKVLYKLLNRNVIYTEKYYMDINPETGVWWKNDEGEWEFLENANWCNNGNKLYSEYNSE